MLRSSLLPLRATVGPALRFSLDEDMSARSPDAFGVDFVVKRREVLGEARFDPLYERLLPQQTLAAAGAPAGGYNVYPLPTDLPVAPFNVYSLFCFGPAVDPAVDLSRKLAVEVVVDLGKDPLLVGGMCFGGHPFLPAYVDRLGQTSSNFGLPREVRIGWDAGGEGDFLDDTHSVTRQEIASHCGVQLMATGPVLASRLRIRFSDFPRILQGIGKKKYGNKLVAAEFWGFAIPYLFFYGYEERMRYRPRVPAGLVAAHRRPYFAKGTYFHLVPEPPPQVAAAGAPAPSSPAAAPQLLPRYAWPCADQVVKIPTLDEFVALSAASLFGQKREYLLGATETLAEFFTPGRLRPGDELWLLLSQSEEEARCLSGLKLSFPPVPADAGFSPDDRAFALEIMEVDPPPGVSPVTTGLSAATTKYCRRLYRHARIRPQADPFACRFSRATSARTIALVLRCPQGLDRTVPTLQEIELVQSAHVHVACRPASHRSVGALSIRLVGEALGDDYSRIGAPGLGIVVEHLVAGQRRAVLLEANSLSDLVQSGAQTMIANHRYEEVLVEVTRDQSSLVPASEGGANFERASTHVRADGWTRSETGEGIVSAWTAAHPLGVLARPDGRWGFNSVSGGETRSQATTMLPESGALTRIADDLKSFLLACINAERARQGQSLLGVLPAAVLDAVSKMLAEGTGQLRGPGSWEPADLTWAKLWGMRLLPPQNASIDASINVTIPPNIAGLATLIDRAVAGTMSAIDRGADAVNAFRNAQGIFTLPVPNPPSAAQVAALNALGNEVGQSATNVVADYGVQVLAETLGVVNSVGYNLGANVGVGLTPGIKPVGIGLNGTGSVGIGGGISYGFQLPVASASFGKGRSGSSTKQAQMTATAYSQHTTARYDGSQSRSDLLESQADRRSVRTYNYQDGTQKRRTHGAEVQWQGTLRDIVLLRIAVNVMLPATGGRTSDNTDHMVRVRFGRVPPEGLDIDVKFEIAEEAIRDDD